MVSVRVRRCTFGSVSIVSTEVPPLTTDAGLNDVVARPGAPLTVRFTVPANPGPAVIVTVYVATPPRVIVRLAGAAEIEKSPFTTVIVRAAGVLVSPPLSVTVNDAG